MFEKYVVRVKLNNDIVGYVRGDGKISGKAYNKTKNIRLAERFSKLDLGVVLDYLRENNEKLNLGETYDYIKVQKDNTPTGSVIISMFKHTKAIHGYVCETRDDGTYLYSKNIESAKWYSPMEADTVAMWLTARAEEHGDPFVFAAVNRKNVNY